jgi:hypothetical protein
LILAGWGATVSMFDVGDMVEVGCWPRLLLCLAEEFDEAGSPFEFPGLAVCGAVVFRTLVPDCVDEDRFGSSWGLKGVGTSPVPATLLVGLAGMMCEFSLWWVLKGNVVKSG